MKTPEQRAQQREFPEPQEGNRPVPKIVVLWILILIAWGVGYYAWQIGKPMTGGDSRTITAVSSEVADGSESSSTGGDQAGGGPIDGGKLYTAHCVACHQPTGQGIPGAFPPLAGSEWVQGDPAITVAIVHDGLHGEIEVAGTTYNSAMPKFAGNLSNAEIAAVLTFVRQEWGNTAGEIEASQVDEHQSKFGDRDNWSADELKQTFQAP